MADPTCGGSPPDFPSRVLPRFSRLGLAVVVAIGLSAGAEGLPSPPAPPLIPSGPARVDVGAEFWIDIFVGSESQPVSNLFGVSFRLVYADAVAQVDYVDDEVGEFLGPSPLYFSLDDGEMVGVAVTRLAGEPGLDGSGRVARIKFSAVGEGIAHLVIDDVTANDPAGNPIALAPGRVEVQIGGPSPRFAGRVFLEGPYEGGLMRTALRDSDRLPLTQPYSAPPWEYQGLEEVGTAPPGVVDWILVELRRGDPASPPMSLVARRAGFVRNAGEVVDLDGTSPLSFPDQALGGYFVVVEHRNHLAVMTSIPVDFASEPAPYDFAPSAAQAYGSGAMTEMSPGVFGMIAGDADGNNHVQPVDRDVHWSPHAGRAGYLPADFDLNGEVQDTDAYLFWAPNLGAMTGAPAAQPE